MKITKEQKQRIKDQRKLIKSQYEEMLKQEEERNKQEKIAPDSYISLQHINKVYENYVQAVFDFNLDIKEHELIVFVGPSGCGKSTTLRMIAGLESITTGDLFIKGQYCNEKTAKERNVAMVFQNYALYPHMTVYQNLAFGLQIRGYKKPEIDQRVKKAAEILQITEYLDRHPKALSGGQQQRVALGRAIVREADVFLMDEPLSNLDAKLRVSMRSEIIKLHRAIKATTIYVTHDQTEAMTMADRIVIMKKGYIQQIGKPEELYNHPANTFVATFIGAPAMNLINAQYNKGVIELKKGISIKLNKTQINKIKAFYTAKVAYVDKLIEDKVYEKPDPNVLLTYHKGKRTRKEKQEEKAKQLAVKTPEEKLQDLLDLRARYLACLKDKFDVIFGIRPEDIYDTVEVPSYVKKSDEMTLKIAVSELLGSEYYIHLNYLDKDLISKVRVSKHYEENTDFKFIFDLDKSHIFDPISEEDIL